MQVVPNFLRGSILSSRKTGTYMAVLRSVIELALDEPVSN